MSLRTQAVADFAANINRDNDEVTLFPPVGVEFTVKGQVTRIDLQIDPDTGAQVFEPKLAISIPRASLTDLPDESWMIMTTDGNGTVVEGYITSDVQQDRTLGYVSFIIEAFTDE